MQSSRALRALPVVLLLAPTLPGQTRYRVITDGEWFHQEPDGKRLARLARGALVTGGEARGDWLGVTIEGWIFASSVGPTPRAGFDLTVTRVPEENLRSAPSGALVAKLAQGFLLTKLGEDGSWVRVQRAGWVRGTGVEPAAPVTATRAAASDSASADSLPGGLTPGRRPLKDSLTVAGVSRADTSSGLVDSAPARAARRMTVYRAPDGPPAGALAPEVPLRVLGRAGGGEWTRVQFEAWVKTDDIAVAPPGVLVGVSAAELRADPARYQGQVLRWNLQHIALQQADELRPDIPAGATYMLARGPLPERGFVYVIVPDERRATVDALPPLTSIQVTARVRAGRSRFLGHPVVDLLSLETRP